MSHPQVPTPLQVPAWGWEARGTTKQCGAGLQGEESAVTFIPPTSVQQMSKENRPFWAPFPKVLCLTTSWLLFPHYLVCGEYEGGKNGLQVEKQEIEGVYQLSLVV